jgi:hypothetical protein
LTLEHTQKGKQESLRTRDRGQALLLLHARNEAERVPTMNLLYTETLNRYSPTEKVKEYFAYAPIPPDLAQQRQTHTTFPANGRTFRVLTTTDQRPYHCLLLMVRISALNPSDHTNIPSKLISNAANSR